MVDFVTYLIVVLLVGGGLFIYTRRIHVFTPANSVVAKTLQEAKNADGYWLGKPGWDFSRAEKMASFKRAKRRSGVLSVVNKDYAKCERSSCRAWTFYGNADKPGEHLRALTLGYRRGVGGHRVPKSHGGGREKRGPIWLCDTCNSKESNEINEYVIAEVRREGKKIFAGR